MKKKITGDKWLFYHGVGNLCALNQSDGSDLVIWSASRHVTSAPLP